MNRVPRAQVYLCRQVYISRAAVRVAIAWSSTARMVASIDTLNHDYITCFAP